MSSASPQHPSVCSTAGSCVPFGNTEMWKEHLSRVWGHTRLATPPRVLLCMCPEIEQGSWTLSSQLPGPVALMSGVKVSVRLPIHPEAHRVSDGC